MAEETKLVGTMELARILGVSHTAVGKAVDSGRINITKKSDSGRPLFDSESCMRDWAANSQAIMQRGDAGKGGRPRADGTKAQARTKPVNLAAGVPGKPASAPGLTDKARRNDNVSGKQDRINANNSPDPDNLPDEGALVDENGIPNLNRATATEKYYKALKAKLDYEEAAGKLIAVDSVAKIVEQEYARVRARLLAIPSKLAPEVSLIEDVSLCRSQIEAAVLDALRELSADEETEQVAA